MERFQPYKNRWREILLILLLLLNILVWIFVLGSRGSKLLKVYFLDVGQGDAILIESPAGNRVLIDGGRGRQVVSGIGRALPFGEREISVVIATHPDADHIGGLPLVFDRYNISLFVEPRLPEEEGLDSLLEEKVKKEKAKKIYAERGQVFHLGAGAKLTILFPDRDVASWDSNDASVVARLDYGEASFLFTGDAGIKTENILMNLDREILDADVLKAGHHGSRTSTSLAFAEAVSPEISVISAGKGNSYGHPHQEVLEILERAGSEIKNTAQDGTVRVIADGEKIKID